MIKKALLLITTNILTLSALGQVPAFPGAEGVARYTTTGGRGGQVIHVSNLNDSGPGSLRAACTTSGKRVVVFDVSGTIQLKSQLKINKDDITILGQTAPGDGICVSGHTLNISANNVILRFLRCRLGDETNTEDDAMNAYFHTGSEKKNIIIDHCSMSWSVDECGSFYGIENFTLQWCMLSESLVNSIHGKGAHGYGGIWGGKNAAYHHNLLANHSSRNPRFDHDYVNTQKGPVDYINNVVYNWGGNSTYGGESANDNNDFKKYNIINNYYKPGSTSSNKARIINPTTKCSNCTKAMGTSTVVPGHFYITGNYMYGSTAVTNDNWQGVHPDNNTTAVKNSIKSATRFVAENSDQLTTMHTAQKAFDKVLAYVGASYRRDSVDRRIVKDTRNGTYTFKGSNGSTGGFIDTQGDVGGWPTLETYDVMADSDGDGMPDVWEQANGGNLDPKAYTLDTKGYYTNIEVYANSLVEDLIKQQNADAGFTLEEYYPATTRAAGVHYYDGTPARKGYGSNDDDPTPTEQQAIYTWDQGTESGGTIVAQDGTSVGIARDGYTVIQLNGKKATVDESAYVELTLNEALQEKDQLSITAYRNKDTDAAGSIYFKFANGTIIDDEYLFNNIHANVGQQPNTNVWTVGAGAGSKSLKMTRGKSGTNVFIIKLEVLRSVATGISNVAAERTTGAVYNLSGQRVGNSYRGLVIKNGRKYTAR